MPPQLISIVIPVYNEAENLPELVSEIGAIIPRLQAPCELLFVDDHSSDDSLAVMRRLAAERPWISIFAFPENRGQSAALAAGFRVSKGDVVITLDADLQNDPQDIPMMLERYGEYDMITGWRKRRQDTLSKRIASRVGNSVRNLLTGETIHDTGCSLKVMRGEMLRRIPMFRGLHRFLPTLMRLEGARVLEMEVNHRHRRFGVSKYTNLRRGIEGFQDIMAVRWMMKRHIRTDGEFR
ncbi:MAG: glycosyltransferase family 2 protein [Desulfuromonadia bacterium]